MDNNNNGKNNEQNAQGNGQNQNNGQNAQGGEKSFTQAELDAIVQKRLREEKAKYEDYEDLKEKAQKLDALEEESKTELQKATEKAEKLEKELNGFKKAETVRGIRDEVSKATGVPAHLLTGETKEACEEQAKAIMSFAKPGSYPEVQDGGEVRTGSKGGSTRDQFADWANEIMNNGGN